MEITMAEKKNYNYLALKGANVDDMEFVERFDLDPAVAYTNKLNDVMLDRMEQDNITFYVNDEGMDRKEAEMKAKSNKMEAMKGIKELLASRGML